MVIAELQAGFGNQLFQIANGYARSKERHVNMLLSGEIHPLIYNSFKVKTPFPNLFFKIAPPLLVQKFVKRSPPKKFSIIPWGQYETYEESGMSYLPYSGKKRNHVLFRGFWQSEKYFKIYRNELLHLFQFSEALGNKNNELLKKIKSVDSVSMHIRRGDYVNIPANLSKHGSCSIEYFKAALNIKNNICENPYYFVFTDDVAWAKKHVMGMAQNIEVIEGNEGLNSWIDLFMMSSCKHNIIANSSFSWWGAWLNKNHNKLVIAPSQWFADERFNSQTKDLIPVEWQKI